MSDTNTGAGAGVGAVGTGTGTVEPIELTRLNSPGVITVLPVIPDAIQIKIGEWHVQAKLGSAYTSWLGVIRDKHVRAKAQIAMLQAQADGATVPSFRPGSLGKVYVPLTMVPRGEGSPIVDLLVGQVTVGSMLIDAEAVIPESEWQPKDHKVAVETETEEEEGDENDEGDDEKDDE